MALSLPALADLDAAASIALGASTVTSPDAAARLRQAQAFCERILAAPESWEFCLSALSSTTQGTTRFLCLQVLEACLKKGVYASLPPEVQLRFRQAVVVFVLSRADGIAGDEAYIKNKLALVLGLLIQVDYPDRWPSAFDDFLGSFTSSPVLVDLFLRVLTVVDEEVVQATVNSNSEHHAHFTKFKDTMRASGVTARLMDLWVSVLATYTAPGSTNLELVELCLETMHPYVSWIDIGLVVNDRVTPRLLEFLNVPELRDAACTCFLQIVNKGMDDAAKVQLIATLRIVDVLSSLKLDFDSADDLDFAVTAAKLTRVVTEKLLATGCVSAIMDHAYLVGVASSLVERSIKLTLRFLDCDDIEVSDETITTVESIIACLKREVAVVQEYGGTLGVPLPLASVSPPQGSGDGPSTPLNVSTEGRGGVSAALLRKGNGCPANVSMYTVFPVLTEILIRRMRFPADMAFVKDGEDEIQFIEYRKLLRKSFVNLIRVLPEGVMSVFRAIYGDKLSALASLSFQDAEVVPYVALCFSEGYPSSVRGEVAPPVAELVIQIHSSGVANHPHQAVCLTYLEMARSLSAVFKRRPEFLLPVAQAMLGPTGIMHPNVHVRARAGYFFGLLVKDISPVEALGRPLVEPLVNLVQNLMKTALSPSPPPVGSYEHTQDLIEAVGVLASQTWSPVELKLAVLNAVLVPMLQQLSDGVRMVTKNPATGAAVETEVDAVGQWAQRLIDAMCGVTKTFSAPLPPELAELFAATLDGAIMCAVLLPTHEVTRQKVLSLFNRMVWCLRERALERLAGAAHHIIAVNNIKSLCDVFRLFDFLLNTFRAGAVPFLSPLLMPLVKRTFDLLPAEAPKEAHDAAEREELLTCYFQFLHNVTVNQALSLFLTDENRPQLIPLLNTVSHGLTDTTSVAIHRFCCQILLNMCTAWVPYSPPPGAVGGGSGAEGPGRGGAAASGANTPVVSPLSPDCLLQLLRFIWDSITALLFTAVLKPAFNITDVQMRSVCDLLVKVQVLLALRCTAAAGLPSFLDHLVRDVLPAVGCPEPYALAYGEKLVASLATPKEFTRTYIELVRTLRLARGIP